MRKKVLKIYAYAISIGLIYAVFIRVTGIMIPCFYLATLGLKCPGCGITRMFISLFKCDFISAFWYNPLMFILFFLWNIIGVSVIIGKPRFIQNPKILYIIFWISVISMLIYCFFRNLH